MEFEIKEVSLTLIVGLAFVAALLEGLRLAGAVKEEGTLLAGVLGLTGPLDGIVRGVALLTVFVAVGIFMEDLSKNALSGRDPSWTPWPFHELMPMERSQRIRPLIDLKDDKQIARECDAYFRDIDNRSKDTKLANVRLTELGWRIVALTNAQHVAVRGVKKDALNALVSIANNGSVRCDEIKDVQELYYRAKNTVYKDLNYFKELSMLRAREDFSRSAAYVAILGGWMLAVALLVRAIRFVWSGRTRFGFQAGRMRLLIHICLLASVCLAARTTYISEEFNANSRIFGYFEVLALERQPLPELPQPSSQATSAFVK